MSTHFESSSVISRVLAVIVSEGALGFLVLNGISVVVAIGAHRTLRNFVIACGVAAVVSTALFNIAASMQSGYVEPFWPIAVVVGGVYAFVVSALVGAAFWEVSASAYGWSHEGRGRKNNGLTDWSCWHET